MNRDHWIGSNLLTDRLLFSTLGRADEILPAQNDRGNCALMFGNGPPELGNRSRWTWALSLSLSFILSLSPSRACRQLSTAIGVSGQCVASEKHGAGRRCRAPPVTGEIPSASRRPPQCTGAPAPPSRLPLERGRPTSALAISEALEATSSLSRGRNCPRLLTISDLVCNAHPLFGNLFV